MECKVVRNRITIPAEVREKAKIQDGEYLDIYYNEKLNSIVIDLDKRHFDTKEVLDKWAEKCELKPDKSKKKEPKKPSVNNRNKIEANYMDADKLYKAYYSECGLLVRTKNSYVKSACERCQGKLAEEYEDRLDVHCSYISKRIDDNKDKSKNDYKTEIKFDDIEDIKKKRKSDIKEISNKIKKATKVIDKKVNRLNNQDKPKRCTTDNTLIRPFMAEDNKYLKCNECGQYVERGFLVDDDFLCKKCTTEDFKKYMKRRGK